MAKLVTHELKCHPAPFQAVWDRRKPYEVRPDDRNFQVGDRVLLREWDPRAEEYTGATIHILAITYISRGPEWGLPEGLCVFGFVMGQTARA